MPRLARLFVNGCPIHFIQRGHNKQDVFLDDADRSRYLEWMWESAQEHNIAVHAWVLMSNHVHLAITPPGPVELARFAKFISQRYTQYFNYRYQRTGTLWQGRFKSSPVVSDHYLLRLYRYIDLNPVRARIVQNPADYRWSSYMHHVGIRTESRVSEHLLYWQLGNTPFDRHANYRQFCQEGIAHQEVALFTEAAMAGWALQLESESSNAVAANRPLKPAPRGRPRMREAQ